MTKPDAPYRELWVTGNNTVFDFEPSPAMECKNVVHVIEFRAVEELRAELKKARQIKAAVTDKARSKDDGAMAYSVVCQERDTLKSELEKVRKENEELSKACLDRNDIVWDCNETVAKLTKENAELRAENIKYRQEMDKINQGIPSEWAYAILQKERDKLRTICLELIECLQSIFASEALKEAPFYTYCESLALAKEKLEKAKMEIS